jgi:hypothetical protein
VEARGAAEKVIPRGNSRRAQPRADISAWKKIRFDEVCGVNTTIRQEITEIDLTA